MAVLNFAKIILNISQHFSKSSVSSQWVYASNFFKKKVKVVFTCNPHWNVWTQYCPPCSVLLFFILVWVIYLHNNIISGVWDFRCLQLNRVILYVNICICPSPNSHTSQLQSQMNRNLWTILGGHTALGPPQLYINMPLGLRNRKCDFITGI